MHPESRLQQFTADLAAARERLAAQERADPEHEVAIAMFRKDVQRAEFRLTEYQATLRTQGRVVTRSVR